MGILKFAANEIVGSWPGLQPHLWVSTWALEWLGPDHNLPSGACGAQGLADLEEPAPLPASALCWVGQGPRPRCPTVPPLPFHSLDFDHGKQEAYGPLDPELGVGTQHWGGGAWALPWAGGAAALALEAKTPAPLNHPVFWLPGPHLPTHPTHSPPSPILSPRRLKPCQLSSALTSPLFCFSTLCLSLSSLCVLCLALSLSSSFCLSPLLCHPFLVFQFLAVSLPLLQQCFLYPPGLGSSHSSDPEPLLSPSLPHFV